MRLLAEALRTAGAEVEVIGVGRSPWAHGLPPFGRFHGTPVPRGLGNMRSLVRSSDCVHIIGYRDPVGTAAALLARRAGVPYVLEPVGMYRRRLRTFRLKSVYEIWPGRSLVAHAGRLIATSRLEADELTEDGIRPARVVVRPNGLDPDALRPLPARGTVRTRLGIGDAPLVLSLGRISRKKGLLDLVSAIEHLPELHALIAGPDDRDGTLELLHEHRAKLRLEARVHVMSDWMGPDDKAAAFADADVFCLPSATENFAIAAAEAAALGLPVVLSDSCGCVEFLDPAATRVVPHGDIGSLSRALTAATGDTAISSAARASSTAVRERLDWRKIAEQQVAIYETLVRTASSV